MADPVTATMAGVSIATTIGGGIMSAQGAAQKDDATAAMYNYKAAVAAQNQKVAAQNALYETQRGGVMAQEAGMKAAQQLGLITAGQAASGIDVNSGTAKDVRTSQLEEAQTTEGTIRGDAARRAYGYQVQGLNFAQEGVLDTSSAGFAKDQETYDVASSLLGAGSSVADKWMTFKKAGVFSG